MAAGGRSQELRRIRGRRELAEAKADLAAWLKKRSPRHPKLTGWAEETAEATFTCYWRPRQRPRPTEAARRLGRRNGEIKRRTHVVRISPNAGSCLRRVRARAVATREDRPEADRSPNTGGPKGRKKLQLRGAARSRPSTPGPPPSCRA